MSRLGLGLIFALGALAGAAGCGHRQNVVAKRLSNGTIHLRCANLRLAECLDEVENLCDRHKFVVVRAFDARDLKGVVPVQTLVYDSEAYVRCEATWQWDGTNKALVSEPTAIPPAPAAASAPAAPPRVCTPGATQACVGPGACAGGQVCKPDGSGFGPCDCGPAKAAPAAPPPAAPSP
jgi:hypothetical protein